MLGKLLDKASYLKAKITGDELELALNQATNDENWQASTTVLHEISSSAYNHEKWKKIHDFLMQKLKNNKNWRKILKVLNIVDFILKNGPGFAVNELKYEINFFAPLTSYQEFQNGSDKGASIRERAKQILGLLQNEELLQDERLRAKQIRQKMSHLSGTASWNSQEGHKPALNASKYESFNNKSFEKAQEKGQQSGYYNYGSGNYGDRVEDVKYNHDYFENLNRFKNSDEKPKSNSSLPQNSTIQSNFKVLSPLKPINSKSNNQNSNKPKFNSLSQKLAKSTTKTHDKLIKPDLSYKKNDPKEDLIDTEAYFIQTRYNFHQESNSEPGENIQTKKTEIPSPQKTIVKKDVQLLNEFQGISFPGVTTNKQPMNQANGEKYKQNPLLQNQSLDLKTVTTAVPQPQNHTQAPIINYSLTYNQIGPIQPTYNAPYSIGSHFPQIPYNANAYQPVQNFNPYANYAAYPQPFQQHIPHYAQYSGYPNPYQHTERTYNQFSGTILQPPSTYQNNTASMTTGFGLQKNSKSQITILKTTENSLKISLSAQKANNDQNIGWTSNNQKNLTDLSDLALEIGESNKKNLTEKPKETNNRLKIDPWAW